MQSWKDLSINILFSIIISSLVLYLSSDQNLWNLFWGSLSIPPQIPFSDLKAHLQFYECYKNGINVYIENCNLIPFGNANISTHPKIWLNIVNILNLENFKLYSFFIFATLTLYFSFMLRIFYYFKNFESKIFFLIFFFSTANFILLERFATDIIIFIIVYLILNIDKKIIQGILIFLGIVLKYYPIFLTSIFINNKKYLLMISLFFIFFIIFFYIDEIRLVSSNILEISLMVAYGARSIAKAIYHLSNEYNFIFNEITYQLYRDIIIYLSLIYSFFLVILGYKYNCNFKKNLSEKFDIYFIGASSIYVGTYIFGSNFDYRLIFLVFTIPFVLNIKNVYLKNILIISYIISLNSFLFQHSNYLFPSGIKDPIYYTKSLIIYFSKFIILTMLSYLLGSYLKKINFFKIT